MNTKSDRAENPAVKLSKIKLSNRMKSIADIVTLGKRVADIGCDHALVSIYLAQNNLAEKVIAMDVAEGPLASARANIERYGLTEKIETRLSDGMTALKPNETNAAVIAGMGGYLVIDILKNGLSMGRTEGLPIINDKYELYLSPQSELPEVRRFLRENSFSIVDEQMMQEDGKYYNIIKAVYEAADNNIENATDKQADHTKEEVDLREKNLKENNLREKNLKENNLRENNLRKKIADTYGEKLIEKKSPVLKKYLEEKIEKLNGIYCRLSKQTGDNVVDRMAEINNEVDEISKVLEEMKG